jgi:hypothetical protein
MPPPASAFDSQNPVYEAPQPRHLGLDDIPDNLGIDAVISMNENISEPGDLAPLDFRPLRSENIGDVLDRSPMISRFRITASTVLRSLRNARASMPLV